MTKKIMKDLVSISEHHRLIKEELNFVYETLIIGLIDDAKRLDAEIGEFLDFPIKGIFYNDSCVLRTGKDHIYYKPNSKGKLEPVIIECPYAFMKSPEELFDEHSVSIKVTQAIVSDAVAKKRVRFTPEPSSHYVALCFLVGYINEIMGRINGDDTVFYMDKYGVDTQKVSCPPTANKFVKEGHNSDVILATHPGALSVVKNIESSICRFMEYHDWKYIRIASPSYNLYENLTPVVRMQACGDIRIIKYHNDAIEDIVNMKDKIENGLVSDIRIAEAYRDL